MMSWMRRGLAVCLLVLLVGGSTLAAPQLPELVPLRLMAETAGAEVVWDEVNWGVTITTADGLTATVRIGDQHATIGGESVPMGAEARLVGGRMMVSPAFLESLIGMTVRYDAGTDTAQVDQQVVTARALARGLTHGGAAELWNDFSPALKATLPAEQLGLVQQALSRYGEAGRLSVVGSSQDGLHRNVELLIPFKQLAMRMVVRFDQQGLINDWHMAPYAPIQAAGSPDYADPVAFTTEEVLFGEAPWALPGTLTLPVGEGPFPVVVLVHGSGPNDRDSAIGGVKLFRDLAEGLATKGIATLRYDKRTLVHSAKFGMLPNFTIQQETVADALAAATYLRQDERINPEQIFVLGHSLGGIALPRILAQDEAAIIRGGIAMAAPNSFLDALWEQNQYGVKAGEAPPQQLPFIQAQIAMLRDPAFDPNQPPAGFLLGMPHYWADLVPKAADLLKGQDEPVLFLQGGRDFQVPASQLESFRADLAEREKLTYQLFPKLNHLFTEGEGEISTSAEYYQPANVPVYVIEAIVNWIQAN